MKEKYNPNGENTWVYDNSRTGQAEVGTTVVATDAPPLTNNVDGYEKDDAFNDQSTAVVKADGSTVLIVHYKLIRYTLVFNINNANGVIKIGDTTYQGSNYQIRNVVLGQDIGDLWPAFRSEVYIPNNSRSFFDGWTGAPSKYITKQYELVFNHVQNADSKTHVMTYVGTWETGNYQVKAEYYLQQADGTYKIEDDYTQSGLHINPWSFIGGLIGEELGAKEIAGYKKHSGVPNGYKGNDEIDLLIVKYVSVYRFYYDRDQYTITYNDGGTVLRKTDPLYFGIDISGDEYNYKPEVPSGKEDYTWGGWYADAALQEQYEFNTMPGNHLNLYAKWIAPIKIVSFDLQGGTGTFPDQEVEKGKHAENPGTPERDNYDFAGWHISPDEDSELYEFDAPVTDDITIYAHWTQQPLSYVVHYYQEGTTTPVLPDKTISNQAYEIGQVITEKAVSVRGYRPDAATKSVTLSFDAPNVITFYYSRRAAETKYTVHYVLENNPTIKVHESKNDFRQ